MSANLSWVNHVEIITAEASRTLKFLKRHLRACPPHMRPFAYELCVRPNLGYVRRHFGVLIKPTLYCYTSDETCTEGSPL